jgi:hypothetical protein
MEDLELIERYFLNELSKGELAHFNNRLDNDPAFKKQFEIESVLINSIQYAQEKQRMKAIHGFKPEVDVRRTSWYKQEALVIAGGSALAVWLLSSVVSPLLNLNPAHYRWMGLMIAILSSFAGVSYLKRKVDLRVLPVAFINGLIIFVIASGIDSINQGIRGGNDHAEAALIPFTEKGTWWPTQSLVDSLVEEKSIRKKLAEENFKLNQAFTAIQDSCFNTTFDNFVPIVVPKSSTVTAGGRYEANVFLAASNSRQKLDFFANGQPVIDVVDPHTNVEMGKIQFTASAEGNYDPKTLIAKNSFDVQIRLADTTLTQAVEYFVAQPVIRVTTGNAPTLYMDCGNIVNIEVPALGTSYNPTFSALGASIVKGDRPGKVTIIPTQRRVTVNVTNDGTTLGSVAFEVMPIPLPRFVILDNSGSEIDWKQGVRGNSLTGLRIVPEADADFKKEVPDDAVYKIRSMEVIHARGASPINRMSATSEVLDFSPWRSQFKPGDRIVIEIKNVTRINHNGEEEKVEIRNEVYNIPIQ